MHFVTRLFLTVVFAWLQWPVFVAAVVMREVQKPYDSAHNGPSGQPPELNDDEPDDDMDVEGLTDAVKADMVIQAQASWAFWSDKLVSVLHKAWPDPSAYDPTAYPMPTTTQCTANDIYMFDRYMSVLTWSPKGPRALQQVVYCLWDNFETASGSPDDLNPDEFALCMHMMWRWNAKRAFFQHDNGTYYKEHFLTINCSTCFAYASYKAMHSLTKDCKKKCEKPKFAFCPDGLPDGWCIGNLENKTNTAYWKAIYDTYQPDFTWPPPFPLHGHDIRPKLIWTHSPDFSGRDALVTGKDEGCSNNCKECIDTIIGIGPDVNICLGRDWKYQCDTKYPPLGVNETFWGAGSGQTSPLLKTT